MWGRPNVQSGNTREFWNVGKDCIGIVSHWEYGFRTIKTKES